jgi:hypothetical protein
MIRMAFKAPPPDGGGGSATGTVTAGFGTEPAAGAAVAAEAGEEARIAAPHLLQNLAPEAILAPQELQNAMAHPWE